MSVETINPAEDHLDELVAGLIDCARTGRQLAQDIFDLQQRHGATIQRQIALSHAIDMILSAEYQNGDRRQYIKSTIAEKLRLAVYPEQLVADAEPPSAAPELYIVRYDN